MRWHPSLFQEPEFEPEGKFQGHFDQGNVNLLRVSGEFELSELELTKLKITEKWGEIQTKLIGLSSS